MIPLFFYKRDIHKYKYKVPSKYTYESCPSTSQGLTQEDEGTNVGAGTLVRVNLSEV